MTVTATSELGLGRFISNSVRCWWQVPVVRNARLELVDPPHDKSPAIIAAMKPIEVKIVR